MTHQTLNYWILGVSIAMGLAFMFVGAKSKKSIIWNVIGIGLAIGGFVLVGNRNDEWLMNQQIEIIQTELEGRFHLSGAYVERIKEQTREIGNQYVISTEDGQYTAQFNADKATGFELQENYGESLRGRRNAYEAIYSVPEEHLVDVVYLEYKNDSLYTLKGELGEWQIIMNNQVVEQIIDDAGVIRYTQQETSNVYEGEIKDE